MPDQFWVNHGGYGDANAGLTAEVTNMDTIMADLNSTLSRISEASGGKATPLWEEQQTTWNNSYIRMKEELGIHTSSSIRVANTFLDGDDQGMRVMA